MSRGPDGNSAHISQDFHLLELAPSPRGGVAGVSTGQSLHPSGCGSYVTAEYTAGGPGLLRKAFAAEIPGCPLGCRAYEGCGYSSMQSHDGRATERDERCRTSRSRGCAG